MSFDLVKGSIPRLMLKIAIPASVGLFFNTMYNVVDTFYAGRFSTAALAALTANFPIFIIILGLGYGLSSGAMVLIANSLGAKRQRDAVRFQSYAFGLGILVNLTIVAIIYPFLGPLFRLLGVQDPEVLQYALEYARVVVLGSVFFVCTTVLNAGLNARGLTSYFRNTLIVGTILNIGLDPLFMYGLRWGSVQIIPAMGISGVAIATILVQVLSSIYLLSVAIKHGNFKEALPREFLLHKKYTLDLLKQGIPSSFSMMTMALGAFVINYFVTFYGGKYGLAAYGSALRIEQIALLPTMGINTALSALVGQNNGAKRFDRVRESYTRALQFSAIFMVFILAAVVLLRLPIMRIFTDNETVVAIGGNYMLIQALTFYSYILIFQGSGVLQGIKKPTTVLIISVARQFVIPLAVFPLFAGMLGLELNGIWWGIFTINWLAGLATYVISRTKVRTQERIHTETIDPVAT